MSWMSGNLDKVQNKYKCSCGAESVHGVYDDENNHIGEFCDICFGEYLINQGAGHDLDISTSTYKELAELRAKQARLTQRPPDQPLAVGGQASMFDLEDLHDVSSFGTAGG